jgi:addiction module RelE/StbE family toxin
VIRWTRQGLSDLEQLHEFISRDNIEAASRTVQMILQGLETAEIFPEAGRKGTRVKGTRELVLYPYIVVYRPGKACIEVVAVVHGARKWPGR